ncbi:non-ribosomal peptide synthetase, partial [Pseudoalteromonas sp. MMG007]|nr:non-ribosomal peptide synthetase [Pseudoalteromonas sp. MMG007]
ERLYRTGDLVRWLENGELEFMGRVDHQLKIRGFRIEPGEIEQILSEHDDVADALVVAQDTGDGDKRLVAYVVSEQSLSAETLKEHISGRLPDYMVPSAFVCLSAFPLTTNGKVDRRELPAPDMSGLQEMYVAPRTETEVVLCDIWAEVLGLE